MRKLILLLVLLTGFVFAANAQSDVCLRDFDFLVQRIKADYPGYDVKVTPKTSQSLQNLEDKLRKKIAQYPDSCYKFLSEYAEWFKDNHLRVRWLWNTNSATSPKKDNRKYFMINDSTLKILKSKSSGPDGIWHSLWGDIAIIKQADSGSYTGVSISHSRYDKNQVICTLSKGKEGKYNLVTYPQYNDYAPVKSIASLRLNDRILELHDDTRLVRKTDSQIFDEAFLKSYTPEFPNGVNTYPIAMKLSDSTFLLRITFFMDETESQTKKHWSEITSVPNLIIDIRDNGGGQDYFLALLDLLYTYPYESKGVEWYATEENIKMYEEALEKGDITDGEEGIRWTKSLLEEMKKNVGKFVIHPMMGSDEIIKHDTIYKYPKRIGIIINDRNASSAEELLLAAKHSSKAILFGNCNTAGVLDYSNAVPVNFPSDKYELNMPMTRSRRLPQNPIDNIGIPPDVMIPYPATVQLYDRLDQWDYFVKEYLENMNSNK
ncbi:MAG: S41 family peptidase [Bacteroidales bacterium]|jgi:hypothetical protein